MTTSRALVTGGRRGEGVPAADRGSYEQPRSLARPVLRRAAAVSSDGSAERSSGAAQPTCSRNDLSLHASGLRAALSDGGVPWDAGAVLSVDGQEVTTLSQEHHCTVRTVAQEHEEAVVVHERPVPAISPAEL